MRKRRPSWHHMSRAVSTASYLTIDIGNSKVAPSPLVYAGLPTPNLSAASQECFMNLNFVLVISILLTTPAFGQGQKNAPPTAPKPTKADVQKVVQTISADKTKMQAYCELAKLSQQMEQADKNKDTATLQNLGQKADSLAQKLGPDYAKLMDGLDQMDPTSREGKEFADTLGRLDQQCK